MPFADIVATPFHMILDPTKRLFFLYLVTSGLLGFIILFAKSRNFEKSLMGLFDKRVWMSSSSKLDFELLFLNMILKTLLFVFIVFNSLWVARQVSHFFYQIFPHWIAPPLNPTLLMISYTVLGFIALDFSRFYQHYLFHKIPFLWEIHKIHHSAQVLTPVTLYRTHPLESLVSAFRRIIVVGGLSGVFLYFTQVPINVYTILGINTLDFTFNLLGSNLRHSHIWMSFGPLNYFLMSPAQHQIHHSRAKKHHDKNLGFALSLWDILFGTFYQVRGKEFLIFGVSGEKQHKLSSALASPFKSLSIKTNEPINNLIKETT